MSRLEARRQTANAGAMIFIPENEWVGLENVGQGTMKILFVFSAVGFEEYLRATSVPEGQEVARIPQADCDDERSNIGLQPTAPPAATNAAAEAAR